MQAFLCRNMYLIIDLFGVKFTLMSTKNHFH